MEKRKEENFIIFWRSSNYKNYRDEGNLHLFDEHIPRNKENNCIKFCEQKCMGDVSSNEKSYRRKEGIYETQMVSYILLSIFLGLHHLSLYLFVKFMDMKTSILICFLMRKITLILLYEKRAERK